MKRCAWWVMTVVVLLYAGTALATLEPLQPTADHRQTCRDVVRQLSRHHFRKITIDDQLASRLLDTYLEALDPTRIYFTAPDVTEWEPYRTTLDDALREGDLQPAFAIFNRYRQRFHDNVSRQIDRLTRSPDSFNFSLDETIAVDRSKAPRPATTAAVDDLLRRRLKNEVLNLRLSGTSADQVGETLIKRYRAQLARAGQVTAQDVVQIFLNAYAGLYDPHTEYFSPRATENFNIHMSLSLEGIGAVLKTEDAYTSVVRLVPAGPADKEGSLQPGDRIIGIGQGNEGEIVDVVGWRIDDVVERIRGPKQTVVRLLVIPADAADDHDTRLIRIVRDTVRLEEQAASLETITITRPTRDYTIGVLTIPTFYLDYQAMQAGDDNYKSTTRDIQRLLAELRTRPVDGLIIDLRNNGGGSLQEVHHLTGLFIEQGPVVQIRDVKGKVETLEDPDPRVFYRGPLAVMVNRLSASASEIFAAAIQDYRRGIIVGSETFGKGTVQTLIPLGRGQLKTTMAMFYRINGTSTQHRGVVPDIRFPQLYDPGQIGESALDNALPVDQIAPAAYEALPDLRAALIRLRIGHQTRAASDPEFIYLSRLAAFLKSQRARTVVSLNYATRSAERDRNRATRLQIENALRRARGDAPLADIDDLEAPNEADADDQKPDAAVIETGQIIVDFLLQMLEPDAHLARGFLPLAPATP